MSRNNCSQATSTDELCEKLREMVVEKHEIKDQIRETEKQIDRLQNKTNKSG